MHARNTTQAPFALCWLAPARGGDRPDSPFRVSPLRRRLKAFLTKPACAPSSHSGRSHHGPEESIRAAGDGRSLGGQGRQSRKGPVGQSHPNFEVTAAYRRAAHNESVNAAAIRTCSTT